MSIQVSYGANYSYGSLNDFFTYASEFFTDTTYDESIGSFAGTENPDPIVDLGFWGSFGTFSGTQFVQEGTSSDGRLGFIIQAADGSYLDYTFFSSPSHTIYGEIASISFGYGITQDANGEYSFTDELVSFDGLDTIGLNAGIDTSGNVIDRTTGDNTTHNIVDGLKDAEFDYFTTLLSDNGIDLTLNDTGAASFASLDTIGVSSFVEYELVA
ncbi:MAG: heme acquisition protein HasA [Pseudoalteromonas sp.]|uniref:heme acquisition protein HasA n=1 Tax=Pseudoalteromonas sp. TaxID=53249 RepID=UPI0025EB59E7|nr:heme acquisition protein HasA [Pseudoalteromonas sp.]MCH2086297.1 heme acquisition protein HasA [Pseudoalteromonas sp.]